jgi:hypothetical protein
MWVPGGVMIEHYVQASRNDDFGTPNATIGTVNG